MPAYSFKEQFIPFIEDESKNHTVRELRKGKSGHAQPGDTVYLYFGMRTKWCRKIGEGICTKTESITITKTQIFINGSALSPSDMDAFAWRDGFRPEGLIRENPAGSWRMMRAWWGDAHPALNNPEGWKGVIIHWKLKPLTEWKTQELSGQPTVLTPGTVA